MSPFNSHHLGILYTPFFRQTWQSYVRFEAPWTLDPPVNPQQTCKCTKNRGTKTPFLVETEDQPLHPWATRAALDTGSDFQDRKAHLLSPAGHHPMPRGWWKWGVSLLEEQKVTVCMYVYTYTYIYIHIHTYTYMYIYIYIHYIYMYMYMYMYMYVYVHIYIYTYAEYWWNIAGIDMYMG